MPKAICSGSEKVQCQICGKELRTLSVHLGASHGITVADYQAKFPGAPTIGTAAQAKISGGQSKRWGGREKASPVKKQTVVKKEEGEGAADVPQKKDVRGFDLEFGVAQLSIQKLNPQDEALVPEHDSYYEPDEDATEALALGIQENQNVLIVGPTGCGKTSGVNELCALVNYPVASGGAINMTGDFRVADFLGEKVLEVDQDSGQSIVIWKDGVLPQAMVRGHLMLIDELDAAPPEILFALQSVLELGRKLVLAADGGRLVQCHPRFRIVATANTIGKGDDSELYTGTNVLNEAFLDRWGIVIQQGYMEPSKEIGVIVAKTSAERSIVKTMVKAACEVRKAFDNEDCFCTFSTRRLLNWALLSVKLGTEKAGRIAVLNKLKTDDRKFVAGILQREFGGSWN